MSHQGPIKIPENFLTFKLKYSHTPCFTTSLNLIRQQLVKIPLLSTIPDSILQSFLNTFYDMKKLIVLEKFQTCTLLLLTICPHPNISLSQFALHANVGSVTAMAALRTVNAWNCFSSERNLLAGGKFSVNPFGVVLFESVEVGSILLKNFVP